MTSPAELNEWQPVTETRVDRVQEQAVEALHGLIDGDGPVPSAGEPLPLLWHWLAFLPRARQSELGHDGHPTTGRFLPPTQLRRRMWAAGKVEVISPAMIGETLTRAGQVASVTHKTGRSGDLLFVGVDYEIQGAGHIREHQDIVYRPAAPGRTAPDTGSPDENDEWSWERTVPVDPTLLFRFSALTYNAHRIHYDREYATVTEGYPALVVHGPLQAILLADLAQRTQADFVPRTFSFRALAPAFDDHDLNLRARLRGDELELAAFSSGRKTMTAVATR